MIGTFLTPLGILMVLAGAFLIAIAISTSSRQQQDSEYIEHTHHETHPESENRSNTRVRGGGVIMLGPIPIIFGSDKSSAQSSIILAIILILLALMFFR